MTTDDLEKSEAGPDVRWHCYFDISARKSTRPPVSIGSSIAERGRNKMYTCIQRARSSLGDLSLREKWRFFFEKVPHGRDFPISLSFPRARFYFTSSVGAPPPHLHSSAWIATVLMAKAGPGRKEKGEMGAARVYARPIVVFIRATTFRGEGLEETELSA